MFMKYVLFACARLEFDYNLSRYRNLWPFWWLRPLRAVSSDS